MSGLTLPKRLTVATWNIAAINNNPFEYWLTLDGFPAYNKMMIDVENMIENPGELDVRVDEVFTETMFKDLESRMNKAGWSGVDKVRRSDVASEERQSAFVPPL